MTTSMEYKCNAMGCDEGLLQCECGEPIYPECFEPKMLKDALAECVRQHALTCSQAGVEVLEEALKIAKERKAQEVDDEEPGLYDDNINLG